MSLCSYLDLELQKLHIIDCLFEHCAYVNLSVEKSVSRFSFSFTFGFEEEHVNGGLGILWSSIAYLCSVRDKIL